MTAGAFSEHLDDCEALKSALEECRTDPMLCYYYCNGTVGGQALLSLTLSLFLTAPPFSFQSLVNSCIMVVFLLAPFDTFFHFAARFHSHKVL